MDWSAERDDAPLAPQVPLAEKNTNAINRLTCVTALKRGFPVVLAIVFIQLPLPFTDKAVYACLGNG
jgi:hypothetical protein